jgi:hypothetical protein
VRPASQSPSGAMRTSQNYSAHYFFNANLRLVTRPTSHSTRASLSLSLSPSLHSPPLPRSLSRLSLSPPRCCYSAREMFDELTAAAPALTMAAASTASFVCTAAAARRVAYVIGVSCATPVVGAMFGVATTAGASVLAGQAARAALQWPQNHANGGGGSGGGRGGGALWRWGTGFRGRDQPWDEREVTVDAMMGSMLYALLGRGIASTLPSDVSYPGALARRSMPANGANYANESQKKMLASWLKKDGCHHCGTKVGPVIGDHMPPNKLALGSSAAADASRSGGAVQVESS